MIMKAKKLSKDKTVQYACCLKDGQFLFASFPDSLLNTDYQISYVFRYDTRADEKTPWVWSDYDGWFVVSVEYSKRLDLRCVLSREGQVNLYGPGGNPDHTFQIPEAGVFGEAAADLGYVNRIRAIGDSLYVCGMNRQVYRFFWNGKDLAAGQWRNVAGAMRQPPAGDPPDDAGEAFDQWLEDSDSIDFVDIAGASESDIYAVGDQVWHFNGQQWQQLNIPTDEALAAIKVFDAQRVVMVGHNGTVLMGNATQGFVDLSGVNDNQNFVGVEWFEDKLFLASNLGLYTCNLARKQIEKYSTTLKPDLRDTHLLEAKDGILWSFGFKDLAYFDGQRWTRVDHPDNPPIR
jgi:hypothetical protein